MFLHGDVEHLQQMIVRHWNKPTITSSGEIRKKWIEIQKDMEENIKDSNRTNAVHDTKGPR